MVKITIKYKKQSTVTNSEAFQRRALLPELVFLSPALSTPRRHKKMTTPSSQSPRSSSKQTPNSRTPSSSKRTSGSSKRSASKVRYLHSWGAWWVGWQGFFFKICHGQNVGQISEILGQIQNFGQNSNFLGKIDSLQCNKFTIIESVSKRELKQAKKTGFALSHNLRFSSQNCCCPPKGPSNGQRGAKIWGGNIFLKITSKRLKMGYNDRKYVNFRLEREIFEK